MSAKPVGQGHNVVDFAAVKESVVGKKGTTGIFESVLSGARSVFTDESNSPRGRDTSHPVRLSRGAIGSEFQPGGTLEGAAQRLADAKLLLETAQMKFHHLGGELDKCAAEIKLFEEQGIV